MSIKNIEISIAGYYGIEAQLRQLTEECAELIIAANKYCREASIEHKENIIEEIADVEIMTDQIKYLLNIYDIDVEEYKESKVIRQQERIRCELALHGKKQEEIDALFR